MSTQSAVIEPPKTGDNKPPEHVVQQIDPPSGKEMHTAQQRDDELSSLFKIGDKGTKGGGDDPPADPEPKPTKKIEPKEPPAGDPPADPPRQDPPVGDPPTADPAPISEGDSPELKGLLEAPIPTKNPKTAVEMNAYKEKWAGHVRSIEKRLKDAEKNVQTQLAEVGKQLKAKEAEVEELSGYRLAVDFQADPKFTQHFEAPLNEKKEEIRAFMKQNGISDAALAHLDTVWDNQVQLLTIANQLGEQVPEVGELFRDHLRELRGFQKNRAKAVNEAVSKRGDLIKQRRESSTKEVAERESGYSSRFQELISLKNGEGAGATPKFEFLHKKSVPHGATPDQVKEIEAHNRGADEEVGMINSMARSDDPGARMDMAVLSRLVPRLISILHDGKKRLDAAEEQLDKINKSGNFTTKGTRGSGSGDPPPPPTPGQIPSGGEVFDEKFKGSFR